MQRQTSCDLSQKRNEFVAAISDVIINAYAAPASKSERFCQEVLKLGKPLLTLGNELNSSLIVQKIVVANRQDGLGNGRYMVVYQVF